MMGPTDFNPATGVQRGSKEVLVIFSGKTNQKNSLKVKPWSKKVLDLLKTHHYLLSFALWSAIPGVSTGFLLSPTGRGV